MIWGRDVASVYAEAGEAYPDLEVAWTGTEDSNLEQPKIVRLFKTSWVNPCPDTEVAQVSVEALAEEGLGWCLVAMTVE